MDRHHPFVSALRLVTPKGRSPVAGPRPSGALRRDQRLPFLATFTVMVVFALPYVDDVPA